MNTQFTNLSFKKPVLNTDEETCNPESTLHTNNCRMEYISINSESRQNLSNKVPPDYRSNSQLSQNLSTKKIFELPGSCSRFNLFVNSSSPPPPYLSNNLKYETESLVLSLNLPLKNKSLSPPNKYPNNHLQNISIPQYISQFNLNILKDTSDKQNGRDKKPSKKCNISAVSKSTMKISSNSNSRISRMKKFHEPIKQNFSSTLKTFSEPNRPNFFFNCQSGCKSKFQNYKKKRSNIDMPCNLPKSIIENEPSNTVLNQSIIKSGYYTTLNYISITVRQESNRVSLSSDPINLSSIYWEDARQYLARISTNEQQENLNRTYRSLDPMDLSSICWKDAREYLGMMSDDLEENQNSTDPIDLNSISWKDAREYLGLTSPVGKEKKM